MERTKQLYTKTKEALKRVAQGNPQQAIDILNDVQRQINYLKINNPELSEDIFSLQIVTLNNLACAYNKEKKYRASLYSLLKVNALQESKFQHLSQSQKTPQILHQIATTHSNLCTIYSEMKQHSKALEEIKIAVDLLENNPVLMNNEALIIFYYNYAVQLEFLRFYEESKTILEKALILLNKIKKNKSLQPMLIECIERVQQKINKKETKLSIYFQKCLKGHYPSRKNAVQQAKRRFNSKKNLSYEAINNKNHKTTTKLPAKFHKEIESNNFSMYTYQKKHTLYPDVRPKKLSPLKHPLNLQSQKTQNLVIYRSDLLKFRIPSTKNKMSFKLRQKSEVNIPIDQQFNYKNLI